MEARKAIKQKPTDTKRISDKMKKFEIANSPRKNPYPSTKVQTQNGLGCTLPKEANPKAAAMAPIPGADIRRPKPNGPTRKTFVANTGTKVVYRAPMVATT